MWTDPRAASRAKALLSTWSLRAQPAGLSLVALVLRAGVCGLLMGLSVACGDSGGMVEDAPCPPDMVYLPGGDVSSPRRIPESHVIPVYPEEAAANGIEGEVLLFGVISREGSFCSLEVVRVEPAGWGFETAALEAVSQWRYEPALLDGEPVASYFTVVVSFHTQGGGKVVIRSAGTEADTEA